eukprot:Skav214980  [mRNA]  locus=scaffold508:78764:83263:- [translate_table: standard]
MAEVRLQSLVVVTEDDMGKFVPCAVVDGPADPVIILLKNGASQRRVRSHFERLAPQSVVSSFLAPDAPSVPTERAQIFPSKENEERQGCTQDRATATDRRAPAEGGEPMQCTKEDWLSRARVDGDAELETAVATLLETFERGGDVSAVLQNLPLFSKEILDADYKIMRERLSNMVTRYVESNVTGSDAVHLACPLWRTCFFPLAVLFEAWSRTTGLPTIFYVDAFYTLVSSLLKKTITYRVANFECRARYWAVGTAAPGSGKSPALEPLKKALLQVLRELPDLAPGKNYDGFHVQPVGTHLAAVDRLRHTDGYQFFGASEGGPVLCPSWPTSSTWNQGTHVNWQRYLDAATGDSVQWETAVDRCKKRAAPEDCVEDPDHTNVTVMIMQQVSLFSTWWAAAEAKMSIGLVGRCVFSFAAAGDPGPPQMAEFGSKVVLPYVKDIFRAVLKTVGPHAPLPTDSPLLQWSCSAASQEEVYSYRLLCHSFTKTLSMDETFATCLNKNGYWLSVVAFWNAVLAQMWPSILQKNTGHQLSPCICDASLRTAMDFFTFRFLFGASVLSADMRARTWLRSLKSRIVPTESRFHVPSGLLLKASGGTTVTPRLAARVAPMFRPLMAKGHPKRIAAIAQYEEALKYLGERGFGHIQDMDGEALPIFIKWPYSILPESCKEQLAELRVHPMSFGGHLPCAKFMQTDAAPHEGGEPQLEMAAVPEVLQDPAAKMPSPATCVAAPIAAPQEPQRQEETIEPIPESDAGRPAEESAETAKDSEFTLLGTCELVGAREYTNIREQVEDFLGKNGDMGIYSFHHQKRTRSMLLFATCKKGACQGCSYHVKAVLNAAACEVEIFTKGVHGRLAAPAGGALWTVAEKYAINKYCDGMRKISAKDVRAALKKANMRLRLSPRQLSNFVNRERAAANQTHRAKNAKVSISELASAAAKWHMKPGQNWDDVPLAQLIVLPDMVVKENEVVIAWTCKGMLRRAKGAQQKVVKLIVDGKQKILANEYTVVTVGFVVSNQKVTQTRVAKRKRAKVHTSTQEPFLQALVDSESASNIVKVFEIACALAAEHAGLDLRKQVWQVHKDFALGIEKARLQVFPASRPCNDYPHMRRASYSCLKAFLKGAQATIPQVEKEDSGSEAEHPQRKAATKAKKPTQRDKNFDKLDKIIAASRALPTVQLVDAVWRAAFDWLGHVSKPAAEYLQKHYFKKASVSSLSRRFRCKQSVQGDWLWFATFWGGIVGTYPGSASGTQTIESFHASWETKFKQKLRLSPLNIFAHMQELFSEWSEDFSWEEARVFRTWPAVHAQELFNGQALRAAGRSPAIDYWKSRGKKLTGGRNHFKVFRRTNGSDQDGASGMTTFWVMKARKREGLPAAEAEVLETDAKLLAELLCQEGKPLQELLCKCGVVKEHLSGMTVDEKRLEELFLDFAVVMQGDLPNSAWPRAGRELDVPPQHPFCTCLHFLLHAECEHCLFVKALEGMDGINLANIREVERKGRKRKRPG